MNTLLIDTNFYADIMLGRESVKKILERCKEILLCPIVIGELLHGFKNGHREKENIEQLWDFVELSSVRIVPITEKTSAFFALITHQLKMAGTPIPTQDIWIAACAMEHASVVATHDSHFKKIQNLLIA